MKGMLRGVLFCPLNRGKSGAARIGGGERSEPVSRIVFMSYDTESQSRNVLASPLGEEGHEVAKGCTRVRMIMILLFYVLSPSAQGAADWRSGPRWSILSVLSPVHPFATTWHFPSRGNERYEGKKQRVIYFRYHSGVSPFGGWRHHLARWKACHMTKKANPVTLTLKIAAKPPPQPSA